MCTSVRTEDAGPAMDRKAKLCPTPQAPGEARRFVRHHVTELGFPNAVEDATLIVSELVTNAINAAPNCPIWASVRNVGRCLILEVRDGSPKPPVFQPADFMAEGGRGLHVVDELSASWGWTS